ncbi:MAG TPA: aldo/keto reductase, partial [Deltaproteobacteria bacterium]|nr:aldo/keto reductase [Deltaproteobacteria bacterium]
MKQNTLGSSEIKVSCLGLGTMTFGEQNSEEEAFAQMDCALA